MANISKLLLAFTLPLMTNSTAADQNTPIIPDAEARQRFDALLAGEWAEVFHDPCTDDWAQRWKLDGERATITHTEQGMDFFAGPVNGDDAHHAVLWTKQSFRGDLKIEYDYTKIDDRTENVTILYLLATGSGEGEFTSDIFEWSEHRRIPSMRLYFNHMHTYHISYAANATTNDDANADYIRLRRYMPNAGQGLKGTGISPDHYKTGLFTPRQLHRITIIKHGDMIYMQAENNEARRLFVWDASVLPTLNAGRIGLRHMYTRGARYRDFHVSQKVTQHAAPDSQTGLTSGR